MPNEGLEAVEALTLYIDARALINALDEVAEPGRSMRKAVRLSGHAAKQRSQPSLPLNPDSCFTANHFVSSACPASSDLSGWIDFGQLAELGRRM
jgi:hypothetical protein